MALTSGAAYIRLRAVLFLLAVTLAFPELALNGWSPYQDYPQWRGPDRDGAASSFVEPKAWPKVLTRRWRALVGEGYATPLIIRDIVFVFTRQAGHEMLIAIDANTGKEQRRSSYPAPYSPGHPAAAHGAGPKATPLYHEGTLFTLGVSGIVSAFDAATGARLWQAPPVAEPPYFSAASSLVGDSGLVIGHPGDYGPLTAFDSKTGEIKWTAGTAGFFASPIIVSIGGHRQVVTATQDSIIGVALDGRVLWRYPWEGGSGSTTPLLNGDTIIVSAMDKGVTALKPAVRDGTWFVDTVWKTTDVSLYVSNPVVVTDTVFGLSHRARGQFFALDAKSGETLWLGPPRQAENSAVVKTRDLLFLLNDDAELIVARASRSGFEAVARYTVADSATWAQPAISGNRIFVKDVASLTLWTID